MEPNLRGSGNIPADQTTAAKTSNTGNKGSITRNEGVTATTGQDNASLSPPGQQGYQSGTTKQTDGR
jgi:hypothetical protein